MKICCLTFIMCIFSIAFGIKSDAQSYNFRKPDRAIILPDELIEISGITYLDSGIIACVQDEKGIIFYYNSRLNRLELQETFHIDGDYEGIAVANKDFYILRSDGYLYEFKQVNKFEKETNAFKTNIPALNNEGLCYDKHNNQLLISSKSKFIDKQEARFRRFIYAFDIKKKEMLPEPRFEIDLAEIQNFIAENNITLPPKLAKDGSVKTKKDGSIRERKIRFRSSALAIHPYSGNLFVLAAAEHLLYIIDNKGNIKYVEILDPIIFNKPEGICFDASGTMYISNEAQDRKPTLLMFDAIKK